MITLPVSAGSGSQTYQVVPVGNGTGAGDSVVGAGSDVITGGDGGGRPGVP